MLMTVLLMFGQLARADSAGGTSPDQSLDIYWTDTPPSMDGKMDDACWKEAVAAQNFIKLPSGPLLEKTEVRFAYDGTYLYVFWKLYESRMDQFTSIGGQAGKAQERPAEAAEIQFYPGSTGKNWYMLIGSPSGAHYDLSSALWTSWNPDWQCAAARFDGGWTLEERIPFDEFAQPKQFFATPQTGETWRVQLYRKKTNPEEVSAWSREDNSGPVNSLVFRGKKSGNVVPSAEKTGTDTFFTERSGMLEFVVKGFTTGPVDGTCTISRNGKNIRTVSAQATEPSPCIIDFPYMLPEGGDYRFSVELKNAGRVFYTARAVKQLSPMNETVEALEKETGSARKFLARDSHPAFAGIRQRLQEFTLKIHDVRQQLKTAGSLNASGLATLSDKIAKLAEEWKPLEIDVKLTRLYPGKNPKKLVFFAVGSATANEKIYRDTQYQGSLTAPLTLALAGNEYGSFQLAIIPFWRNLDNVSISFSPLKEPGGDRLSRRIFSRWFIVNYAKLEPPPAYTGFVYTHQNEPDSFDAGPSVYGFRR